MQGFCLYIHKVWRSGLLTCRPFDGHYQSQHRRSPLHSDQTSQHKNKSTYARRVSPIIYYEHMSKYSLTNSRGYINSHSTPMCYISFFRSPIDKGKSCISNNSINEGSCNQHPVSQSTMQPSQPHGGGAQRRPVRSASKRNHVSAVDTQSF